MDAIDSTASSFSLVWLLVIIGIGVIAVTAYRRPNGRTVCQTPREMRTVGA